MNGPVVCFGELLLRLGPPGRQLLLQSPAFDVHVGGAEANVAVSLARLGHAAAMAGCVPQGPLGAAVLGELRRHGVDTTRLATRPGRLGLYYIVTGAIQRPSEILYDRAHSAFALTPPDAYDWPALLAGASVLHVSGVTPALGAAPAEAARRAVAAARDAGARVSFDGNYRAKLWEAWSGDPAAITRELMAGADLLFADHRDIGVALGRRFDGDGEAAILSAAEAAFTAFPQARRLATTIRVQHSVDHHALAALLVTREGAVHRAPSREITPIVDRIGTGDAFAAGVLHGLLSGLDDAASLRFGHAAACLKHSLPGDFNLLGAETIADFVSEGRFDVRR